MWVDTVFTRRGKKPPIQNLVMLAPANFGSPLAHKGRAIYGRVIKGFNAGKRFQTGEKILRALEMASPYSWHLAERDRLLKNPFGGTGIRTTVIVGNTGYRGISSLANELGSDGTVYVSTANLDCAAVEIRFPAGDRAPKASAIRTARNPSAFVVLDGFNHSAVALKEPDHPDNAQLLSFILDALALRSASEYAQWRERCDAHTARVMARHADDTEAHRHGFQNTVFRVRDDQGFDVQDYVIEFYSDTEKGNDDRLAEEINKKALVKVHVNKENPAYRAFMFDCHVLHSLLRASGETLKLSLSALPDLQEARNLVGYRSFGTRDIGQLALDADAAEQFFQANRTLLVDIVLTREQKDALFWIKPLAEMA